MLGTCVPGLREILDFGGVAFYPPAYCTYIHCNGVLLKAPMLILLANQRKEQLLGDMVLHYCELLEQTHYFRHLYPNTPAKRS